MDKQHTIDKLNLDISVKSSEANVTKVKRLSEVLDNLAGVLYDFPSQTFHKITDNLTSLSAALNLVTGDNKQLSGFTSRLGNLNKKISELDASLMERKFNEMTVAITPFLDKVNSAKDALIALNGVINNSDKYQTSEPNVKQTKKKNSNGFLNVAKWGVVTLMAKRLGRAVYKIAEAGSAYTETLNLWETAMGTNLDSATKFVDKMNEAYGISEKTLMNAQAIFKNMLGSLGQISDQTAYLLSEGVTQMALDYASLFNQTFDQAFTKFQAALAGQVRPIRSVAGFDITENTLFQLYESLGGTKSMRQLSRTEKQLLSLLAIFNQMQASGAIGDLDKTMASFANQSKVSAEAFNDLKNWAGTLLTYIVAESKIMVKFNAMLIFAARYLEAIAKQIGAVQSFGGKDPFASTTEGAENALDAINQLQGKLLDFDKFRALNGAGEGNLALDEKLLNAFKKYESILGNASLEAKELSDQWFKALGYTIDENGELILTDSQLTNINDKLAEITTFLKNFNGLTTLKEIMPLLSSIGSLLANLTQPLSVIFTTLSPILTIISEITSKIIVALDEIGALKWLILSIFAFKIGKKLWGLTNLLGTIATKFLPIKTAVVGLTKSWTSLNAGISITVGFMSELVARAIFASLSDDMRKMVAPIALVTSAITGLTVAWLALHGVMSYGLAIPVIMGSVGVGIASIKAMLSENQFADGGIPKKGTAFIAGEAGAEIVGTMSSGQTGVMNMEQLESAVARGMLIGLSAVDMKDDRPIYVNIDGDRFFTASRQIFRRNGFDVSAVK